MPLNRSILDTGLCSDPDCNHDHSVLYLHPRCHPRAGVEARYVKATGLLEILCKTCGAPVCRIEVAAGPEVKN
jgi:hypothetical protein